MKLIQPGQGRQIGSIEVPLDLYWVLEEPAPLAGMRLPRQHWPWQALYSAGFREVVSLHHGSYDPAPLTVSLALQLQDLVRGGPPDNEAREGELVSEAVRHVVARLDSHRGVVVHCFGGRGRTGTVLGCVLRDLGLAADETVLFLDAVHKARGKCWPESPWQGDIVRNWAPPV